MQNAEKLSITLTPEMVKTVKGCVESGEYASTSEVLRDALRLWKKDRDQHAETIASIKARITASIENPGRRIPIEEIEAELEEFYERSCRDDAA